MKIIGAKMLLVTKIRYIINVIRYNHFFSAKSSSYEENFSLLSSMKTGIGEQEGHFL